MQSLPVIAGAPAAPAKVTAVRVAAGTLTIRDDIHEAFLSLAGGIACWRRLANLALCEEF